MTNASPFFQHQADSRAFLARARKHLAHFDAEADVTSFFYAALELRFGIEARLCEYLRPALKSLGKDTNNLTEYVASKLMNQLAKIAPDSEHHCVVRLTPDDGGKSTVLQYTPVSRELAAIHGKLGELLHFKFFVNNEYWLIKSPLGGTPYKSLLDFRSLIDDGVKGLEEATAGSLLGNPQFTEMVADVVNTFDDSAPEPKCG